MTVAPAELAARLTRRWDTLRLRAAHRDALARRANILVPLDELHTCPLKLLRIALAWTVLLENGVCGFVDDYLGRPCLVELNGRNGRDNRTIEGFIDAARAFRGLPEDAARGLVDIAGSIPVACLMLRKVDTPEFPHRWIPANTTGTHPGYWSSTR